jgi:hypothetical protein
VTIDHAHPRATGVTDSHDHAVRIARLLAALFKIGQTARQWPLPGHAIAGCGFKTSIVMLPVLMVKASATSRTSLSGKAA